MGGVFSSWFYFPSFEWQGRLKMRLIVVILAIISLFTYPAWGQNKQVRDSHGRLVKTWTQHGSTTDVRGPDGGLKETRNQRGNDIYAGDSRDPVFTLQH